MPQTKQRKLASDVPEPVLRRLPWYLSHVKLLQMQGEQVVSSTRIARGVAVDSSIVAKDLSYLSLQGRTRVGYQIDEVVSTLEEYLGFTREYTAIVIGVGNLGSALLSDRGLHQYGLEIVAGFDINPDLVGQMVGDTPIYHIDELAQRVDISQKPIAILTVPMLQAQDTADYLVETGITSLWNFTPVRIQYAQGIVVQNTSIYAHLALIFARMHSQSFLEETAEE